MRKWILLVLSALVAVTSAFADPVKRIVFFGDSLSDNGNLHRIVRFVPKSPPYYQGRFSNGPVWAEGVENYFLKKYGIPSVNYAVGGSTVEFLNPFAGNVPYRLNDQINAYLLATAFGHRQDTLYVIWIGGNDYTMGRPNVDEVTSVVVNSITATISRLIKSGGEHFFVLNLPDLSFVPLAQTVSYKQNLHDLAVAHNTNLQKSMADLQKSFPKVRIDYYDIGAIVDDLCEHMEKYNTVYNKHFTTMHSACWKGGYRLAKSLGDEKVYLLAALKNENPSMSDKAASAFLQNMDLKEAYTVGLRASAGETPCENPEEYVFWDSIHPSKDSHDVLSQMIIQDLIGLKIITPL